MRPCFVSLIVVAVSLHVNAVSTTNSNGSVMTPNSELTRNQLVATDVSGLLSSESDPNVVFTNGELLVHGERVKIGPDETEVQEIANAAVETNALTVATTNRVALLESSKADKSDLDAHVANTDNPHAVTAEQVNAYTKETVDAKLDKKADIVGDKIPASQLPSYVDDVLEYDTMSAFPVTGEGGKIYVAKDTNLTYRWSGTQYVEISPSPLLDDTVTEKSPNGVKSSGIWSWVNSLLPKWLTSDYAEPATVASVEAKADQSALADHVANTDNPHAVTAEQIGAVPLVEDKLGEKTAVTIGSRKSGEPVGKRSLANGSQVIASGYYSHAEGSYTTASGDCSHAEEEGTTASGYASHAEGSYTTASGYASHAEGFYTTASGDYSHAEGFYAYTKEQDIYAFAWNGDESKTEYDPYESHGVGTFNINPVGGLDGFWIGEQTLYAILTNKADKADIYTKSEFDAEINEKISGKQDLLNPGSDIHVNSIETDSASNFGNIIIKNNNRLAFSGVELSPNGPLERIGVLGFGGKTAFEQVNNLIGNSISATNPAFSSAVLAVGLNIDTNSVAVLNEIAETFGGFPIEGTATTVGGLLAALAAAAAWLKKNKVGSFASVGGASATVENGVAKLSDFFTESNSLLAGTIDARLPYPLNAVTDEPGLLKDRAINTTSLASVTVPDNFTDLLIRATVASSLAVTMPAAITKYGDTFPGEAGEYLITITKTGAAEAYVRTIKLEEVA